jgi:putative hydrolase of the HAD superfamily
LPREKLAASQLERYFDVVVISGEFGIGKPAVPIYMRALEFLGIHVEAATMVGDRIERDLDGAHAAGIRGVWINRFRRCHLRHVHRS